MTALDIVKKQISQMMEEKQAELDNICALQKAAREKAAAAAEEMKIATERMDFDRYETAKETKRKANIALEMYDGRYNQIKTREIISEEESDQAIDRLLEYENQLTADFKEKAASLLQQLDALLETYQAEIRDTEETITLWGNEIHANYRTFGQSSFYDKATGTTIDRSPAPIPVHRMNYTGCDEARKLCAYLNQAAGLYKQP